MKRAQTNIDLFMHDNGIKNDKDFAIKLGMSQQQLSQRLAGDLSMNTLEIIASYFKVSVKELLR
ncbi:MAG: helix-turn-helix domain-containing protein [Flavobacteriales bacterium]